MIEPKINEIFDFQGYTYRCDKKREYCTSNSCLECFFVSANIREKPCDEFACCATEREDDQDVIFVQLYKTGKNEK